MEARLRPPGNSAVARTRRWRPGDGRHAFSYVIPADEVGAGNTVTITLLSETLAHAREGDADPLQQGRRCQPGIS